MTFGNASKRKGTQMWRITETYPDGGTWKHHFPTLQAAEWALEDLKEAHKGREYVLEELA